MGNPSFPSGLFKILKILHEQGPDCIKYGNDHHTHIGKHRQPHVGKAQGYQDKADQLNTNGKNNVLLDNAQTLTADLNRLGDLHGVIIH